MMTRLHMHVSSQAQRATGLHASVQATITSSAVGIPCPDSYTYFVALYTLRLPDIYHQHAPESRP